MLDTLRRPADGFEQQRGEVGVIDERVKDHNAFEMKPPIATHLEDDRISPNSARSSDTPIGSAFAPMERAHAVFEQIRPIAVLDQVPALDLGHAGDEIGEDDPFLDGKCNKPAPNLLICERLDIHSFHRLTVVNDSDRPPLLPDD